MGGGRSHFVGNLLEIGYCSVNDGSIGLGSIVGNFDGNCQKIYRKLLKFFVILAHLFLDT